MLKDLMEKLNVCIDVKMKMKQNTKVCQRLCVHNDGTLLVELFKGELNFDKKWQSDDLFYIMMNEIHPRFNQF